MKNNNNCGCGPQQGVNLANMGGIATPVSRLIIAAQTLREARLDAAKVAQFKVTDFESPVNLAKAMSVAKTLMRVEAGMERTVNNLVTEIMGMYFDHADKLAKLAAAQPKTNTRRLSKPKPTNKK